MGFELHKSVKQQLENLDCPLNAGFEAGGDENIYLFNGCCIHCRFKKSALPL